MMLANFHTHSVFCDGKNTPEEIVRAALDKGFCAIGFSGHGYTAFDRRYCTRDTEGYIREIGRLKEVYGRDIQIYLGSEEDAFSFVERSRFDYIIGSSHYFHVGDAYLPIDSGVDYFKRCLEAFDHDVIRLADTYYGFFCRYIKARRPDIIGHFDLITKFDEMGASLFLKNDAYNRLAERYTEEAARADCIFEVNTGAISRGFRRTPYPSENLLYLLKKLDARIMLSSDSHAIDTLDFAFGDTARYLYDIGFRYAYTLSENGFVKYSIQ